MPPIGDLNRDPIFKRYRKKNDRRRIVSRQEGLIELKDFLEASLKNRKRAIFLLAKFAHVDLNPNNDEDACTTTKWGTRQYMNTCKLYEVGVQ